MDTNEIAKNLVALKAGMKPHDLARQGKHVVLGANGQYLFALHFDPDDAVSHFPVMQYFSVENFSEGGTDQTPANPDFYWNGVAYTAQDCNIAGKWDEGGPLWLSNPLEFAREWMSQFNPETGEIEGEPDA